MAWAIISALGITTSSVGLFEVGDGESGVVAGSPKNVRGDEYARWSPLWMGVEADGDSEFMSSLGADPFISAAVPSGDVVEYLIFPDRGALSLGPQLDDGPLFALVFWFPVAIVLIFSPYVLMGWGARAGPAIVGSVLIVVAPVSVWWSWLPMFAMVPGVVTSAVLIAAVAARRRFSVVAVLMGGLIGGLALSRTPWSYAPWALIFTGGFVALTFGQLLARPGRRVRTLVVTAAIGLVAAVVTLWVVSVNDSAFTALSETVYPGRRLVTGEALSLGKVFGAPMLGVLQQEPVIGGATNYSELSSTWNVAIVAWLALLVSGWRRFPRAVRVHVVLAGALLGVGFAWVLLDWPTDVGQRIPVLNLVASGRMVAIIGVFAIASGVVLLRWARPRWWLLVVVAVATLGLLLATGVDLQARYLPDLSVRNIVWATAVTTAVVVLILIPSAPARVTGWALAAAGAAAVTYSVGPIQQGLGPLRDSEAAAQIRAIDAGAAGDHTDSWATDAWEFSALLTANGVPMLTGDMWSGPSAAWDTLDPAGQYQNVWNRGASNVRFLWDPQLIDPEFSNPVADVVQVRISPCDQRLATLDLRFVVSSAPLTAQCLVPVAQVAWNTGDYYIYERN